jgi:hypothetical protein
MALSTDREPILVRLGEILAGIEGIKAFKRNEPLVDDGNLPGIMLFDGDEVADSEDHSRGRSALVRSRVAMSPEIYLLTSETAEQTGPVLNRLLWRIVHFVMSDAPLKALLVDGQIRYDGMQTGLALGRSMAGELGIQFTLYRLHDPNQVPPEEPTS